MHLFGRLNHDKILPQTSGYQLGITHHSLDVALQRLGQECIDLVSPHGTPQTQIANWRSWGLYISYNPHAKSSAHHTRKSLFEADYFLPRDKGSRRPRPP